MTNDNQYKAQLFFKKLKDETVEFYTRYQEDEWGCRYLGNGQFLYWTRNYIENQNEGRIINEKQVEEIFAPYDLSNLMQNKFKKRN